MHGQDNHHRRFGRTNAVNEEVHVDSWQQRRESLVCHLVSSVKSIVSRT